MSIWKKLKEIFGFEVIDSKSKKRNYSVRSDDEIEGIYKFEDLTTEKEQVYIGYYEKCR